MPTDDDQEEQEEQMECGFTTFLAGGSGGGGAVCPYMSSIKDKPCVKGGCAIWDSINQECGTLIHPLLAHIHKSHLHPKRHECPTLSSGCGGSQGGGDIPDISENVTFAAEFAAGKDLDGDGKIYGKTFKSSNPPQFLKDLEQNPNFTA